MVKFAAAVCVQNECTPTRSIIDDTEIGKPFCDSNFTQTLPGELAILHMLWAPNCIFTVHVFDCCFQFISLKDFVEPVFVREFMS